MSIYSIYVINRAGSLIYQYDHYTPKTEIEKTFSYPLDIVLKIYDEKVVVAFGQRDGIKVGHTILAVNGLSVDGKTFKDEKDEKHDILEFIADENNFPMSLKFSRSKLSTNEKIMLAGMFHSLYAISSQLSPLAHSSGIQQLETDAFKLHCTQTLTGLKFLVISDAKRINEDALLRKLYEIYADFALKNPFYSIDMPIRCELFEKNVQDAVKNADNNGYTS